VVFSKNRRYNSMHVQHQVVLNMSNSSKCVDPLSFFSCQPLQGAGAPVGTVLLSLISTQLQCGTRAFHPELPAIGTRFQRTFVTGGSCSQAAGRPRSTEGAGNCRRYGCGTAARSR
jgi:hypothetical protein